jgi:hypothetical protein
MLHSLLGLLGVLSLLAPVLRPRMRRLGASALDPINLFCRWYQRVALTTNK